MAIAPLTTLPHADPVRLSLCDSSPVITEGFRSVLVPYAPAIEVLHGCDHQRSDVVIFDGSAGHGDSDDADCHPFERSQRPVWTWWDATDLALVASQKSSALIRKTATADEVAEAVCRVARGEGGFTVGSEPVASDQTVIAADGAALSPRQVQVLTLITDGLTNEHICQRLYISPNTLKTYIRDLYRRIDVQRRSQAVRYGLAHGLRSSRPTSVS